MSLINDDEEPKLKQTVDSSIAKSELERKGGLAAYLSDETEEVVPEGRLPRRPGEKRHKAKQDDRIFTSGQLADMGIGAWIEQEPETPVSPVVQQSAPRPKPVNNSPSAGLLDKVRPSSLFHASGMHDVSNRLRASSTTHLTCHADWRHWRLDCRCCWGVTGPLSRQAARCGWRW